MVISWKTACKREPAAMASAALSLRAYGFLIGAARGFVARGSLPGGGLGHAGSPSFSLPVVEFDDRSRLHRAMLPSVHPEPRGCAGDAINRRSPAAQWSA
jgi:hypothetical protein